jgi:hypothetical protein
MAYKIPILRRYVCIWTKCSNFAERTPSFCNFWKDLSLCVLNSRRQGCPSGTSGTPNPTPSTDQKKTEEQYKLGTVEYEKWLTSDKVDSLTKGQ